MKRICSWLARIRADNVHRWVFGLSVFFLMIGLLVFIIVDAVLNSLATILWLIPWSVFVMSGMLVLVDFSDDGDLRDNVYNIDMLEDFYDLERRYQAVKKERDRLHLLRHTRTL